MEENQVNSLPISEQKLSDKAKELIRTLWKAKDAFRENGDINDSYPLLEKFYYDLQDLVGVKTKAEMNKTDLFNILVAGKTVGSNQSWLPMGIDTSGKGIDFNRYHPDSTEEFSDLDPVRYMIYPKPGDDNIGLDYYTNFVGHFGGNVVNLFQDLPDESMIK